MAGEGLQACKVRQHVKEHIQSVSIKRGYEEWL